MEKGNKNKKQCTFTHKKVNSPKKIFVQKKSRISGLQNYSIANFEVEV